VNSVCSKNIALFYLSAFLGIFSTICVSFVYSKEFKIIQVLASGTILIIATHNIINTCFILFIGKFIEINMVMIFLIATINLIVNIIPIIIVRKWFPILIGGRK
jgi:hypothetical protein